MDDSFQLVSFSNKKQNLSLGFVKTKLLVLKKIKVASTFEIFEENLTKIERDLNFGSSSAFKNIKQQC